MRKSDNQPDFAASMTDANAKLWEVLAPHVVEQGQPVPKTDAAGATASAATEAKGKLLVEKAAEEIQKPIETVPAQPASRKPEAVRQSSRTRPRSCVPSAGAPTNCCRTRSSFVPI